MVFSTEVFQSAAFQTGQLSNNSGLQNNDIFPSTASIKAAVTSLYQHPLRLGVLITFNKSLPQAWKKIVIESQQIKAKRKNLGCYFEEQTV